MDHVRIDEGMKRGKRPAKLKPHQLETQLRNEAGKFLTRYTPDLKAQALERALAALEIGARVEQVADEMEIPRSTMYSWLIGHDAGKARTLFFDGQAAAALADLKDPERTPSPLDLTRAREVLSGVVKIAERRDPKAWAQKQEITTNSSPILNIQIVTAPQQPVEITQIQHGPESSD